MTTSCLPPGITVLYEKGESIAERVYLVQPIIEKYVKDNGVRLDRTPIYYVEISSQNNINRSSDYKKLSKISKKAPIFVSSLNSTSCLYLQHLFFNAHLNTMHINASSTAVSLSSAPNLLRIQIPDAQIQNAYVYNVQQFNSKNCVIIYEEGTYYEGLSSSISDGLSNVHIPSLLLLNTNWDLGVINDFTNDPFTIIFIVDRPLDYVSQMQTDPTINLKSFQILVSDAGIIQPATDEDMLIYLNNHQAQLIQVFIDNQRIAIANEYQAYINNPDHVVSVNVAALFVCLDWAGLVLNTKLGHRLTRELYLNVYLDPNLDNTQATYGGYMYTLNDFSITQFYFINDAGFFVGMAITLSNNTADSLKHLSYHTSTHPSYAVSSSTHLSYHTSTAPSYAVSSSTNLKHLSYHTSAPPSYVVSPSTHLKHLSYHISAPPSYSASSSTHLKHLSYHISTPPSYIASSSINLKHLSYGKSNSKKITSTTCSKKPKQTFLPKELALDLPRTCSKSLSNTFCDDIGICVLYADTVFPYVDNSAETSYEVKRIIDKYISDNGIDTHQISVTYLKISALQHPQQDTKHLLKISQKHKVFVSMLGVYIVQYLNTIFFNDHLDCIHLNCYPNASDLSYPNLGLYVANFSNAGTIFGYYISVWANGVSNAAVVYIDGPNAPEIIAGAAALSQALGVPIPTITSTDFTVQWLNENTYDDFVLIILTFETLDIVKQVAADPTINLKNFQILTSSWSVADLPTTPDIVEYLNSKSARLIQEYLTPRQQAIAVEYQNYINNPQYPVTENVSFLLSCFDWAVLVINTKNKTHSTSVDNNYRLTRQTYQNLQLSPTLQNTTFEYGSYAYVLNGLTPADYFYVYNDVTYFGILS